MSRNRRNEPNRTQRRRVKNARPERPMRIRSAALDSPVTERTQRRFGRFGLSLGLACRLSLLICGNARADVISASLAAGIAVELLAEDLHQVCGLGEEKQLVDRPEIDVLQALEVHAETQMAEEVERLLAGDQSSRAKGAQRAKDFVL